MNEALRWLVATAALVILAAGVGLPSAFSTASNASAAPTPQPAAASSSSYEIDLAHSTLIFRIRHLGVANFYGRINMPKGSFFIDTQNPERSRLEVSVEIRNMDAGNRERDRFILSPDFFNAREHPAASFRAKSFRRIDAETIEMTGDFTMRGVTREVVAMIDQYAERQTTRFGYRAGFEARFTVSRAAFGMDKATEDEMLGDEVQIIAAISGVRQ